jgi:ABC-type polysaccharide/polyol phosphate export permease
MEPLAVLILLPIAVGVAFELIFRDTARASIAATLGTPLIIFLCLNLRDPAGGWNWLATLLVSPLAIAFAIATVLFCFGHEQRRQRGRRDQHHA